MASAATARKQLGEIDTAERLGEDSDLVKQVRTANDAAIALIQERTQEQIMALPTEQRWAEYGKTYEEEQEYRRTHDQNPDGTAKYTSENIAGDIIKGVLVAAAVVVTAGIAAPSLFAGASAEVASGAAVAATGSPEIAAPLAAALTSAPSAAPIVTTIAETAAVGKGVSSIGDFFGNLVQSASSVVDSVADSPLLANPLVQKAIAGAISGGSTPNLLQQANAGVVSPSSSSLNAQDVANAVKQLDQKLSQLPGQQGATKTDWTPAIIGGGLFLLMMFMGGKKR